MNFIIYIAFGFLSGVAAGMGMGGGTVLIPALTLLLSLDQHAAQGVNMLAFLPAAAAALFIHKKEGRLNVKEGIPIILAGVVGALIGAFAAGYISSPWLRRLFGIFLLGLSILQFVQGEKKTR
ncbi:MAG TPA: sulfite exporter TauE/SafE family protein [Clostridia bacterium]|nr:sulfite exporter TauE/SafE family protein [Clostridia bacterium]